MERSTFYKLMSVLVVFAAFITLGSIGMAAMSEPFYWLAFIVNAVLYPIVAVKLYKKAERLEK